MVQKKLAELTEDDMREIQRIDRERDFENYEYENSIGGQPLPGEDFMDTIIRGANKINALKEKGKI